MSHWQALAVKISSSSLRSPPHCNCTFTCRGEGSTFQSPSSGRFRPPSRLPQPSMSHRGAGHPHLPQATDGAALRDGGDIVSIAAGHQHGVPGREGAGLTVAHTSLCHMGALAGALAVTSHCHIEG